MGWCNVVACEHYRLGAPTKTDLKAHLVWILKYRKAVLHGEVSLRVRDLLRQVAAEHKLEIVSGKVAHDHVHIYGCRSAANQAVMMQWMKEISSRVLLQEFPRLRKKFLGPTPVGARFIWRPARERAPTR